MTESTRKTGTTAAVVGLVASVLALPASVIGFEIAAWALALTGLFTSIAGVRRSGGRAGALVPGIIGILVASIILLTLVGLLLLFLTRPFRY